MADAVIRVVPYAAPALVATFTVRSIWGLAKKFRRNKSHDVGLYKDEDGEATEESMAEYSTKSSFLIIFIALAMGLATSFALAVMATSWAFSVLDLAWLLFVSWVGRSKSDSVEISLTACRLWCFCKP